MGSVCPYCLLLGPEPDCRACIALILTSSEERVHNGHMENMTAAQIEQRLHGAFVHMTRIVSICGQGSYEARQAKARLVELNNAYLKFIK